MGKKKNTRKYNGLLFSKTNEKNQAIDSRSIINTKEDTYKKEKKK